MYKTLTHLFLLITFLIFSACESPLPEKQLTEYKKAVGLLKDSVMVVTAHPEATRVGVEILKQGGNAYDAAIAVHFALAVVYPEAGNIGGGGFMVTRTHDGKYDCLDFRETAPSSSNKDMYLDSAGGVNSNLSTIGHLACGIPGSVYGMKMIHEKYGSMEWKKLVEPSIKLAKKGFRLTKKWANNLNKNAPIFKKLNNENKYLLKAEKWKVGDLITQFDLGQTLERIANEGPDEFYNGKTSELLIEEMKRGGGIISKEDLKNYKAIWREPVVKKIDEYNIISMPPPSSGGIALIQMISLINSLNLKRYNFLSVDYIHLLAEIEKLAYADRSKYLGDPDFIDIPINQLLSNEYLSEQVKQINPGVITPSKNISPGNLYQESEQTTHFSIVDSRGNAVSLTTTLNSGFGAKIFVTGAGFLLNNEMDDFSSKPGVANQFGLIGDSANAIEPGKRMLSSMTPTIIEKNNKLFLVTGSPGGATIITSVLQTALGVMYYNMNIQESINAPRFHHQWLPDILYLEKGRFDSMTVNNLKQMGYMIEQREPIGRVDAILIHENGKIEGGADPRGDDKAGGY